MIKQINGQSLDYIVGQLLHQQQQQQPQQQQQQYQQQPPSNYQTFTLVENFQPQPVNQPAQPQQMILQLQPNTQPEYYPQTQQVSQMAQPQPMVFQIQPTTQALYPTPISQPAQPQPMIFQLQQDTQAGYQPAPHQHCSHQHDTTSYNSQEPKIFSYSFELPRDTSKEPPRLQPVSCHRDPSFKPIGQAEPIPIFINETTNSQMPEFKPRHSTTKGGQCKAHAPKLDPPKPIAVPQEKTVVTAMLIYPPHEDNEEQKPEPAVPPPREPEFVAEPDPMTVMPAPTNTFFFSTPNGLNLQHGPEMPADQVWRVVDPGSLPTCTKCHM